MTSSVRSAIGGMDQLAPLTGLRGVAAYSVLIAHAIDVSFYYNAVPVFHDFAVRLAYFGMSLFFVLSGFVIHYNYADKFFQQGVLKAGRSFFVARFARLYPLYAIGIFISLPHIPTPVFSHSGVLASYVTLTQSWFNAQMAIFTPFWSVSTEWFFYLAFMPLVFLLRPLRNPLPVLIVYCLVAMVAIYAILTAYEEPLKAFAKQWFFINPQVSTDVWGWIIYMGPGLRLLEFIAGMLASMAYGSLRRNPPGKPVVVLLRVVMVIAPLWCVAVIFTPLTARIGQLQILLPNFIYAAALAPLMVAYCTLPNWLGSVLSSRPMQFMGEISYSVYTWSFFVMTMLGASYLSPALSLEAGINSAIKVINVFCLTTVFAYGSYAMIEMPARRWIRSIAGA